MARYSAAGYPTKSVSGTTLIDSARFDELGPLDETVLTVKLEEIDKELKNKRVKPGTVAKIKEVKKGLKEATRELWDLEEEAAENSDELER